MRLYTQCLLVLTLAIGSFFKGGGSALTHSYEPLVRNDFSHLLQAYNALGRGDSSAEGLEFPGLGRWLAVLGSAGVSRGALLLFGGSGAEKSLCMGLTTSKAAISDSR